MKSAWRQGLICLALAFFAAPVATARVTVLVERGTSIHMQAARGFEQGFGNADEVEFAYLSGEPRELDQRIDLLRKSPPRLVVAIGTQAAMAARSRLRDVPVVYCLALNPDKNNLVGPDVGGVRLDVDLIKQFTVLEQVLPKAQRIGIVYDEPSSGHVVRQALKTAPPTVNLLTRDARTPKQAAQFIEELMPQIDAFWLLWDPVIANAANFKLLVDLSLKHKVALIAPASPFVEAGALLSIGADSHKAGQRTAEMAKAVLGGQKPGEFKAESPSEMRVTINGAVARRLGISIPHDLRAEVLSPEKR
jgi:putative ABC transport system substrate-binding protein